MIHFCSNQIYLYHDATICTCKMFPPKDAYEEQQCWSNPCNCNYN